MSTKKIHHILNSAFERKLKQRPGYSKRALARDLKVSPAFVTNMFNGKKLPPRDRVESLIRILELDTIEKQQLSRALLLEKAASPSLRSLLKKEFRSIDLKRKTLMSTKNEDLLAEWWFIPVMEALSLEGTESAEEIQSRLGLTRTHWNRAIETLLREGLIVKTNRGYKKKDEHIYLSTGRSKTSIRAFHRKMIEKALFELDKTSDENFARRLITGYTFALSPPQLEELKEMIMRFLDRSSRVATQGRCTELYQMNVQLFPLTKNK